MSEVYSGRQFVGMDLHRRRSVLVRMTESGEHLETVRIVNTDDRLADVMFGDHSGASRLRDLEAILEGPRVGVAARFSAARSDGGAAQLAAVSEEFERMGDLVAAVDAAAQAALAYRRQGLRGSALGCSARAAALAEQCGADTPALRQASEPLPLTDREREIVMLIGEGLSNRVVAERLTLSVRTVESHIYRAMLKTGTTSRDELAALIPGHGTRTQ